MEQEEEENNKTKSHSLLYINIIIILMMMMMMMAACSDHSFIGSTIRLPYDPNLLFSFVLHMHGIVHHSIFIM
jgi:hypothetical protein